MLLSVKESRMNSGLVEPKHIHSCLWLVFGGTKAEKVELTDPDVHLLLIVTCEKIL